MKKNMIEERIGVDLMTTKKEYRAALDRILATYYNLDNSISAGKKFNEDMKLLYGLVNDHFKDEIIENSIYCFALADGKPCQCSDISCSKCGFSTGHGCGEKIKERLNKPYEKPKYKLTQFEYDLLSVHKDFKTYNNIANQIHLFKMYEKGYFKDIDTNIPIREILDNCEVIK